MKNIAEVPIEELSQEQKQVLRSLITSFRINEAIDDEIAEYLKISLNSYIYYSENWLEKCLPTLAKKTINHLAQKLEDHRNKDNQAFLKSIFKSQSSDFQKIKKLIRENLYNIMSLSLNEKAKVIDIINRKVFSENEVKQLFTLLKRISEKELNLLGFTNKLSNRKNKKISMSHIPLNYNNFENPAKSTKHNGLSNIFSLKNENCVDINTFDANKIMKEQIPHYNRWFTDNLQKIMRNQSDKNITKLFSHYIAFNQMSKLFKLSKNYFKSKRLVKYSKNIISKQTLEIMRINLKEKISSWKEFNIEFKDGLNKIEDEILKLIDQYEILFKPKSKPHSQILKNHPNLNLNYFSDINTLEKAYWLGFLIADGWLSIEKKDSGDLYRLGIELSVKDKNQLINFCAALGIDKKYIRNRKKFSNFTGRYHSMVNIRIIAGKLGDNNSLANDLINLGVRYHIINGKRIKRPMLPKLNDKKLMLSYLLGFYDGDGSLGKSNNYIEPNIVSTNKDFLQQIKSAFNIENNLCVQKLDYYDHKIKITKKVKEFRINLSIQLFKQLMKLPINSLPRKRVPLSYLDKPRMSSQREWLLKLFPKKEILENLLKIMSPTRISLNLGLARETITSFCKDFYDLQPLIDNYYKKLTALEQHQSEKAKHFLKLSNWKNYLSQFGKYSNL